MKMRRHYLLLLVPLLLAATPPKAPDTILTGGSIITMAGDEAASVEAILVREGRIATTGSLEEVKKATRGKAETVDLKGRTLLPGFIDAHGHMGFVGQNAAMAQLQPPPVAAVDSIAKLQEVLRDFQRPNGMPLIIGNGYDDSQLAERRHPTRADLDAVSATVPILLLHVSGHFGSMNSAMLKLVGYGPDTPDPQGGVIRREADGKTPNGVVEETAMYPIVQILTPPSVDVAIAPLIVGAKIYAANGITTGQDGRVMPSPEERSVRNR
ncbi:MAG: amidohydrolase family protein [Sphingomonadales bacterium]|nr:amidohydrolase family protein [Sphingomonadales bacterium]